MRLLLALLCGSAMAQAVDGIQDADDGDHHGNGTPEMIESQIDEATVKVDALVAAFAVLAAEHEGDLAPTTDNESEQPATPIEPDGDIIAESPNEYPMAGPVNTEDTDL